jgi:hypothetical protein
MGRNGELFNYFILTGSFITRMLWIENLSFLRGYLYKGICLFLQKEKNLSEHLFLGRSRWAKQTIYQ